MKRFVVLHKKIGETPLTALREWQKEHPEYAKVPASYAGRLDPMASGALLVLFGDECKRQAAYTGLDKEYEIEVLLGVGSDTGDVLGLTVGVKDAAHPSPGQVARALRKEAGAHLREYPVFSSKTVKGKPLFMYALEGTLDTIQIPQHTERIYSIRELGTYSLLAKALEEKVAALLTLVPRTDEPSKKLGDDFRIDAVRKGWSELFKQSSQGEYVVLKLRVTCASGTYMRSLAGRIGESFGTKALALSINRSKIGRYVPFIGGRGLWYSTYTS